MMVPSPTDEARLIAAQPGKHDRYNRSEKGRARWRRYSRSPKATSTRAVYALRKMEKS